MDDFRIPDTPRMAHDDPFDPYDGTTSVDITGLGVSTPFKPAHFHGRGLDVDPASTASAGQKENVTRSRHHMPAPVPTPAHNSEAGPSRITYFSALTQRGAHSDRSVQIRPFSTTAAKTTPIPKYGPSLGRPRSQQWESDAPVRATQNSGASQPGTGDAGYRGIQDAIATKFQDLEKQIADQEHEITELRFSRNDATVAVDALETDKRQLKQKIKDLERNLRKSGSKASKLQADAQKDQDALEKAVEEQKLLQHKIVDSEEKAKKDAEALSDARETVKAVQEQLEATQKEQRAAMQTTVSQNRQAVDISNKKIADLEAQLQIREAELVVQREANAQLAKRIEEIPERNFQALGTCVKKIIEKLDSSKAEILARETSTRQHSQEQHGAMVQYLNGLLTSSKQHLEMIVSSRDETKGLVEKVLDSIQASDSARKDADVGSHAHLQSLFDTLQDRLRTQQAGLLDAISTKCRESDVLASVCDKQEAASRDFAVQLNEQLSLCREQNHHFQDIICTLHKLQEAPKEHPRTVAKIQTLQDQKARLESDIKDRDMQITRLEEAYKERTGSILEASDGFVKEIRQLNSSFREREVEYRRALDQASNLANKEAKRNLDKARDEAQKELQHERTKRQALERDLRQSREDLSVLEENSKRIQQSYDASQRELNSAKLGNQAVTEHLEERARALDAQIGRETAVIAKLKAALADKEMDYANLQSSMEAYDEKVHILIEHLRGWAQDYIHVGAIRSRLEMLGQIDQSCMATARIREAEQIDSVLALLRQYNARQNSRQEQYGNGAGKGHHVPFLSGSDKIHEQQISNRSAFLDAEVGRDEDAFKTPANGARKDSSAIKPPPVLNNRTFVAALEPESSRSLLSPGIDSSPVPQYPRRSGRALAAKHAENHGTGSPTGARASRKPGKSGRKRPFIAETPVNPREKRKRRYTQPSLYFKGEGQGRDHARMDDAVENDDASDDISTSPPSFIKIEGV